MTRLLAALERAGGNPSDPGVKAAEATARRRFQQIECEMLCDQGWDVLLMDQINR